MINAGMPAMPLPDEAFKNFEGGFGYEHSGLTKREHFAGLAMQGINSNPDDMVYAKVDAAAIVGVSEDEYEFKVHWPILVAKKSVAMADALLAELEKDND